MLQLLLDDQVFHVCELVVVLETLRVGKCTARLDALARDDLLYRQLYLLQIHGRLQKR